jgi:uracil-DNA glycosylase
MTKEEYFGDWSGVIDLREADRIIKKLSVSSLEICPQLKDVFKAFKLCSLHNLRVIVLGQDPYPQKDVATGIAFANKASTPEDSLSPSLEVLRESVIDYTIPHRTITFDPSLEKWEEQGVLLLNTALSCEVGRVGSHTLLWMPFISGFLTRLQKCSSGIVYVLMGSQAQSFESYIDHSVNYVIKCRHPSYYARTKTRIPSDIWKQVNQILISQNGYGIEWYQET